MIIYWLFEIYQTDKNSVWLYEIVQTAYEIVKTDYEMVNPDYELVRTYYEIAKPDSYESIQIDWIPWLLLCGWEQVREVSHVFMK